MPQHITYSKGIVYIPTMISAVTVSTTSAAQLVASAKAVVLEFYSLAVGETQDRAGNLTVTVSTDGGTNFRAYSMLLSNATNTNTQTLTRVSSLALTAGTAQSGLVWMSPETLGGITHIKAVFTRTTEGTAGTFTVRASIAY